MGCGKEFTPALTLTAGGSAGGKAAPVEEEDEEW